MIQHLACIMDGNRRWAYKHGNPVVGKEGVDVAHQVIRWCVEKKIPYLSLFAFSLENFKRSPLEMAHVFALIVHEISRRADELVQHGINICFVGDRTKFPADVREACEKLEKATASGSSIKVCIYFCYGARQEILDACKSLMRAVADGTLHPDSITHADLEKRLWAHGVPDPDLIMRTGYVQRLSNFLLYQAAYAELYFPPLLWPDVTDQTLNEALAYYHSCKRNFGV
jgi:undecaprenyl diphosphate synthase